MSKEQGDGFRTTTNHELNAYRERYRQHLIKIVDEKVKQFEVKPGVIIQTEEMNMVERAGWKWNGIKVVGKEYFIRLLVTHSVLGFGWGYEVVHVENDRDKANKEFLRIKEIAKSLPENFTVSA